MITVKVLRDGEVIKEFKNQTNDFEGFKYLLDHQSASTHHAVKYEGWNVIGIDEETKEEVFNYKKDNN